MPRPRKSKDTLAEFIDRLADAFAARLSGVRREAGAALAKRKRNFSKAGIERIRAAAKKRWAKWRRAQAAGK